MVKNLMKNMLEIYIKKCELAKEYLPKLIDIHLHGGGEADTMDATQEAMDKILIVYAKGGSTSIVPTTLSLLWTIKRKPKKKKGR